jgi:hypothetical protein
MLASRLPSTCVDAVVLLHRDDHDRLSEYHVRKNQAKICLKVATTILVPFWAKELRSN